MQIDYRKNNSTSIKLPWQPEYFNLISDPSPDFCRPAILNLNQILSIEVRYE